MQQRSPVVTGVLIALAVIGILLLLWALRLAAGVVLVLLIAMVLATGMDPLVERMQSWRVPPRRWRLPRGLSIALILLLALLLLGGLLSIILIVAWQQGQALWEQIPTIAESAEAWLGDLRERYPQIPPFSELAREAQNQLSTAAGYLARTAAAILGAVGAVVYGVAVLVLTFYLQLEKEGICRSFAMLLPETRRHDILSAMSEAGARMGGWVRGQLLLAGIVFTSISLAMWLLGVPYPLLFGLIGGIAELVPMLGPFAAGVIAIPIAFLTGGLWVGVGALVFFAVLSQVEEHVLAPKIMKSQVGLSPLVTILALLAGAGMMGAVGALLAVPLAAGVRVLILRLVVPAIRQSWARR
jgi:predicted PurR-regulated permease PerM